MCLILLLILTPFISEYSNLKLKLEGTSPSTMYLDMEHI